MTRVTTDPPPCEILIHVYSIPMNMTRYRVLDLNDNLCGVWYAASAVEAIALAIAEGYDAWSVDSRVVEGW